VKARRWASIGPNGSGKSTLLQAAGRRRQRPPGGEVRLDGSPARSGCSGARSPRRLAVVEQHAETADSDHACEEAVELGRTPWLSALRALE
jgi:ABC-type cobalamin/Fe3+-siderophores transport system ATPase subunit